MCQLDLLTFSNESIHSFIGYEIYGSIWIVPKLGPFFTNGSGVGLARVCRTIFSFLIVIYLPHMLTEDHRPTH